MKFYMKKLLIHNNNTAFNQIDIFEISEQFVFDIDFDKDVDVYMNEILCKNELQLKCKLMETDIVFIKLSLSQNYLEYLGLRLSYHIRLTKSLGEKAKLPIVLIAEENFQFIGITCTEPSILFTNGIYLIKETIEDYKEIVRRFENGYIKILKDLVPFINSISINPPANYQSHHSIANEWALFRYFSMLKKDERNEQYNELQKKIQNLEYLKTLHFKYLEQKVQRQIFNSKKSIYAPYIGKIEQIQFGIIDDEINKGWMEFYNYLFNQSKAYPTYFNDFKKDESKESLIKRIEKWLYNKLESNQPISIFIIDLRLHDDDFSEKNFDDLSGIQLIKFIKFNNPGIQIIVSTASNKVWNYQKCLEYGASYYTIKESPETYNTRDESATALNHFIEQIKNAIDKSFLAKLYSKIKNLKLNNFFTKYNTEPDFNSLVFGNNGLLDKVFNLLILDTKNEVILNQCLVLAFQVLENYCDLKSIGVFTKSSGSVCLKLEKEKLENIYTINNEKISTRFELSYSKFCFQSMNSKDTITSFKIFEEKRMLSFYQKGLDHSFITKMISILYFREDIAKDKIDKIIKLRYYRSNIAAHLTNNIKPNYEKINAIDIVFFINLFIEIFIITQRTE